MTDIRRAVGSPRRLFKHDIAQSSAVNFTILAAGVITSIVVARSLGPQGRGEFAILMAGFGLALVVAGMGQNTSTTFHVSWGPGVRPRVGGWLGTADAAGKRRPRSVSSGCRLVSGRPFALGPPTVGDDACWRHDQRDGGAHHVCASGDLVVVMESRATRAASGLLGLCGCPLDNPFDDRHRLGGCPARHRDRDSRCRSGCRASARAHGWLCHESAAVCVVAVRSRGLDGSRCAALSQHADKFMLVALLGVADAGIYAVGLSLMAVAAPIGTAIANDPFPRMAALGSDLNLMSALAKRAVLAAGLVTAPILILTAVAGQFAVPVIFGREFAPATVLLWPLGSSPVYSVRFLSSPMASSEESVSRGWSQVRSCAALPHFSEPCWC